MKERPYRKHPLTKKLFSLADVYVSLFGAKRVQKGIRMHSVVFDNERGLDADLFFPAGEGPYPVFVNVHGGGFVAGDKKYRRKFCSQIAGLGYFVMNVNYTTCDVEPYPAFLRDCLNAVSYLVARKEELNLDLDRLVVGGDSAGGYISHALGVAMENPHYFDALGLVVPDVVPRAVVSLCGLYSLQLSMTQKMPFDANKIIASYVLGQESTIEWTDKTKLKGEYLDLLPVMSAKFPECFVSESLVDPLCKGHAGLLVQKLKALDIPYTHVVAPASMHCWHLTPGRRTRELMAKLSDFLIKVKAK